jgi:hypothetical protein
MVQWLVPASGMGLSSTFPALRGVGLDREDGPTVG